MRADLHVHTYFSDGLPSPEEVAIRAESAGVELLSVTDHDGMLAYPEIITLCADRGIKCVEGIEVSAYLNGVKIHILGYLVNHESEAYKRFYKKLCEGSFARAEDIVKKLNKAGVRVTLDEALNERASALSPVHAMHISRACAKKGYCNSNPFTVQANYMLHGKPAYSDIGRPLPEEAILAINESGGFASLAHPGRIEMDREGVERLVKKFIPLGLGGIEAVYSAHTDKETAYYKEMAGRYNLVVTGGSDSHGTPGGKVIGSPVFEIDYALAKKLRLC